MKAQQTTSLIWAAALASTLSHEARSQPYDYALFRLNAVQGTSTQGWGINGRGDVVGSGISGIFDKATAWSGNDAFDLSLFADLNAEAHAVNNSRIVVGGASSEPFQTVAGYWNEPAYFEIGTLGGETSIARALNSTCCIVGWTDIEPGIGFTDHAFRFQSGSMEDLGVYPGGCCSRAYDINDAELIVGQTDDGRGFFIPSLWESGTWSQLPLLNGHFGGEARAINELGQIAGQSFHSAVLWDSGVPIELRGGFRETFAYDVNDLAEVVGFIDLDDFDLHAFLWRDGEFILLDDRVPPNSGFIVEVARAINNRGQITGDINSDGGRDRCFLASPVNPAFTLTQPSPGLAGTNNTMSISGAIPGAAIYLAYGTVGGGEFVGNCDLQDGVAVQIDEPTVLGPFVSDANGDVTMTLLVPSQAANLGEILIQGVDPANCQVSQLIVESFE